MTDAEAVYGFYSDDIITFSGDFTFIGSYTGVNGNKYTIVESGKLKAVGGEFGEGLSSNWELYVKKDVERLEMQGDFAAYSGNKIILDDGIGVVDPAGGCIELDRIEDSAGNRVKYAVIGKPVAISGLDGKGTADEPYLISSTDDWNILAQYTADGGVTSGKFFKMTDDITVSTSVRHFSGTFDGGGHTLTLDNCTSSPFTINGATIRNLKTAGTVSGGRHISGLVGGVSGTADNLIENCNVAATITTSDTYCGGFIGHGGNSAKVTISDCVFSGTINSATAGTFWGWSDSGSTPVLINCLDISDSTQPIGRGDPKDASVTNCYYTKNGKETGGGRPWNNQGKLAYTVSGDGITLKGTPGIAYDGKIYAAEGERISLTAADADAVYIPSAGAISQNGSALTLTMPGSDVNVAKTKATVYGSYTDAAGTDGNNNEEPDKLVDGKTSTKWCYSSSKYPITLTFRSKEAIAPIGYILITANDTNNHPERNPKSWKLEGSTDGKNWTVLTEFVDSNILEGESYKPYTFPLNNPDENEYSYFRFTVNGTVGGGTFQLSELQLINAEYKEYDLWLGSTQVTSANKNDILGDGGKAKFDPETGVLTLSDPTINGVHGAKILSKLKLTLKGSYHMTQAEEAYGLHSSDYVTFSGDFTFFGWDTGIYSLKYTTVESGKLKAVGGSKNGVYSNWEMFIKKDVERLEMEGNTVCYDGNRIVADKGLIVAEPEGGFIDGVIRDPSGNPVKRAVIEKKPVTAYDLWLGSTQVTSANKNDILGDGGKAKFDPETNTLTLSDPVIKDCYSTDYITNTIIYTGFDLTLKGSYHTPDESDARTGILSESSLTFDGDFTFIGGSLGVWAKSITVKSGNLNAVGKSMFGIYAINTEDTASVTFENDVVKAEATGGIRAIHTNDIVIGEKLIITAPDGATVGTPHGVADTYNSILNSDGTSAATYAVIEPKPPVILGDIDGDGEATILDATLAQRYATRVAIPYDEAHVNKSGDVDGEGEVTVIDATFIQRYATRVKVPYPIGEPIY